jgi:hypothetical protein
VAGRPTLSKRCESMRRGTQHGDPRPRTRALLLQLCAAVAADARHDLIRSRGTHKMQQRASAKVDEILPTDAALTLSAPSAARVAHATRFDGRIPILAGVRRSECPSARCGRAVSGGSRMSCR